MTRHYKYKHGKVHQHLPPPPPLPPPPEMMLPPPPPPPQKVEEITLSKPQESEGFRFPQPSKTEEENVTLQHPFTLQAIGCTGSGKTCWMKKLLERARTMIKPPPERIIWCYKRWQPLFGEMNRNINNIIFIQGLPEDLNDDSFIDSSYPSLIVIDDLMRDATNSKDVCELFVEGSHHRNISVACIMQSAFSKGKENRTMSVNSQYIVLFKNPRDMLTPTIFARQMYPNNIKRFMSKYVEATKPAYGYLFIDLKQNTPDDQRLKSDIFKGFAWDKSIHCNNEQSTDSVTFPMVGGNNSGRAVDYKRANSKDVPHSENNSQSVNMEKQNPSCIDCGTLFSTDFDVQRHIKRGCPMDENTPKAKRMRYDEDMDEDNDDKSIDSEYNEDEDEVMEEDVDMDDSAFNPLIDDVYEQLNEDYQKRVNEIMTEQGLNKARAKEEANEIFLPRERRLLIKEYKQLLFRLYALKQSPLHRQITSEIHDLMEGKSYSFEKATPLVLRKNRYLFDELLDHEEDNSDDESEPDNDTDDNNYDDSDDDNEDD